MKGFLKTLGLVGIILLVIVGGITAKKQRDKKEKQKIAQSTEQKIDQKIDQNIDQNTSKGSGNTMLTREEIEPKYKWNLEHIYANWSLWEKDVEKMKVLMAELPTYRGKISTDEQSFVELMKLDEELSRLVDKVYLYPYLMKDLNSKDELASTKLQEIEIIYSQFGIETSWITPEILKIPKETMITWIDNNKELEGNRFGLMEIYRLQDHVLDEKSEELLSNYSQFNGNVNDIYQELTTSDIKWNKVRLLDKDGKEGDEILVTNGVYSKIVSTDRIQENRKRVFEALYNTYDTNKNTYGAIYRGILQRGVAASRTRGYKSTLDRALEPKNIDQGVYLALIKSAKENNAPLRRYVDLRKKHLGLNEYHYYDNSVNIIDYDKEFSYEEAKTLVLESVKPLGAEYTKNLEKAISDGWLDVYETENKRSGAYSINIYDVHPYMLLNYNGTMDAVYTLAHELGHTLHSMYSSENQPYATSQYTIFVAEVASTFNERLLLDHMLANSQSKEERIALLEQAIGGIVGTYYMQSLFADYEYQAHKLVEDGKPITPEVLDNLMTTLFKEYFDETLTYDDLQKIIWSRIPHFYNSPYYVYQYATSFSASSALYDKINNLEYSEESRNEARELYLTLLKSGGNDHPMNQLKKAGVDLSKIESFEAVSHEFDRLLDMLEKELESK